jgi:hypothetical protein
MWPTLCHADQTTRGVCFMATVFGISGFKSRLDDWRGNRKINQSHGLPSEIADAAEVRLMGKNDDDYDLSLLLENLVIPKLIADRDKRTAGFICLVLTRQRSR